jgi:hypothetical protein
MQTAQSWREDPSLFPLQRRQLLLLLAAWWREESNDYRDGSRRPPSEARNDANAGFVTQDKREINSTLYRSIEWPSIWMPRLILLRRDSRTWSRGERDARAPENFRENRFDGEEKEWRAGPWGVELIECSILYRMATTTSRTDKQTPNWLSVNEREAGENRCHRTSLWPTFEEVASTLSEMFLRRKIALFALYKTSWSAAWALSNWKHDGRKIDQKSTMFLTRFLVFIGTFPTSWDKWEVSMNDFVEQASLFRMAYESASFDRAFDSKTSKYKNECFSLGRRALENVKAAIH